MTPVTCLLVDDDHFVREGLAAGLRAIAGINLVGTAGTLEDALHGREPVDIVLLDLSLPTSCRRTATGTILAAWPRTRVLVITAYATGPDILQAFSEGARGYVTKSAGPEELAQAVHAVAAGQTYVTPTLAGHLLNAGLRLSRGERAVLRHVAEGRSDKDIAAALHLSPSTVENRLAAIRSKAVLLGRSRSELTKFAHECDPFCGLTPRQHEEEDRRSQARTPARRSRIRRTKAVPPPAAGENVQLPKSTSMPPVAHDDPVDQADSA